VVAGAEEFIGLYERESRSVLVFFVRRTFDAEVAMDLTAETFAQAWRGWARVRPGGREETRGWLFTIARRQLSRYRRRGRVEQRALRQLGLVSPSLDAADVAEIYAAADVSELREVLRTELASLTSDQRDALRLRIVEELPYDVVARRLGISETNARARVSRGLRALARALDPLAVTEATRS
jgi:RNA polymerase sigma-70 factor (ECF subfamily)